MPMKVKILNFNVKPVSLYSCE